MIYFFLFLFGISAGSFLNVLIDRLSRGEPWISGRSHCDFCKHTLSWYDLIPLFSFYQLKGKCRYCHKKLPFQYPLSEFITGSTFVLTFIGVTRTNGSIPFLIFWLITLSCYIVIIGADLKYHIIPDEMLVVLLITTLLYGIGSPTAWNWFDHIRAAVVCLLFFLSLVVLTKGKGMGFGDVKYVFYLGLILGSIKSIVALYIAFLTGSVISLILILGRRKTMKSTVPFGPFLVVATFISAIYGESIWNIALRLLGL
jgi:prepilin signal peptidase PulO-like enzyme (type II secretory pathway)